MDTSLSVRVFEWRGELHVNVDRVGRVGDRKYAPRTRLATRSGPWDGEVTEEAFLLAAIMVLVDYVGDIAVLASILAAQPRPASPSGDHRGERVATGDTPSGPLPSQAVRPSVEHSASAASSDGLWPPGGTEPLF